MRLYEIQDKSQPSISMQPYMGWAYVGRDGGKWMVFYANSRYLTAPTIMSDTPFQFDIISEGIGRDANLQMMGGEILSDEVVGIEARLADGEVVRALSAEGIFTILAPMNNDFCAIRAINDAGETIKTETIVGSSLCIPDPFWGVSQR